MKKKLYLVLILILSMVFAAACGNSNTAAPKEEEETNKTTEDTGNTQKEEVDFPNKAITLMVPYDAGGGTDLGFRVLASSLEEEFGVPVVVVNKPGGNGWVGWEELQKAKPDGYTIAAINGLVSGYMNPSAKRTETLEDFTIIANHVFDPGAIAIKPDESRFTTIEELIEYAKENEVMTGFSTVGSDEHFSILTINKEFGTKFIPVQLGGASKVMTSLMGGHVDIGFANVGEVLTPAESGQIEVIAVFAEERVTEYFPDVPTLKEAIGFDYVAGSPRGLGGPKGIDPKIVEILNSAIEKAMQNPDHIEKMDGMGLMTKYMNAAEYEEFLKAEEGNVKEYIEELGWGQ